MRTQLRINGVVSDKFYIIRKFDNYFLNDVTFLYSVRVNRLRPGLVNNYEIKPFLYNIKDEVISHISLGKHKYTIIYRFYYKKLNYYYIDHKDFIREDLLSKVG